MFLRNRFATCTFSTLLGFVCLLATSSFLNGQDIQDRIQAATNNLNQKQTYLLEYKFGPNDQLTWNVEQTAKTKTQIAGTTETSSVRTISGKRWVIKSIETNGDATFVYSIDSISMWQQIDENDPAAYDSRKDKSPPPEFTGVDEKINKPLAVIKVSKTGKVLDRKSKGHQSKFGVGDICTPLPTQAVPVGYRWYVPTTFSATEESGRKLQLKARINYQLTKVKEDKAYISFKTEVLTPIESEKVHSQLLQQLNDGYLVFDISAGRRIRKEVEWNEKVQGYEGPDSFLQYTGRMTETYTAERRKISTESNGNRQSAKIRQVDDAPIIRK